MFARKNPSQTDPDGQFMGTRKSALGPATPARITRWRRYAASNDITITLAQFSNVFWRDFLDTSRVLGFLPKLNTEVIFESFLKRQQKFAAPPRLLACRAPFRQLGKKLRPELFTVKDY